MQWENPHWLFALWLVPALGALLVVAHRRRIATAHRFVDPKMVERLMPDLRGWRPWTKGGLWLVGITLLLVGMSGPRFGIYFEKVATHGADLFVLLDVSRSMQAEDVAPNRLERAKSDVRDLLTKLAGDRVGLIVFAGAAVVKVPLTTDQGFFLTALADVDTASAPRGGSLIGDAIRKAIESMDARSDRDQVIVLITDGEDHDSFPAEAARQAADRHIKFITVGLGDSSEGMRIPIRDETGRLNYLKHDGQEVWSRMDERLLKEIALTTGGAYIPAKTRAYDLGQIYEDHLAGLKRGEIETEKRKRYAEQFQLFAFLGLGLLIVEMLLPRYQRKRWLPGTNELPRQEGSGPPGGTAGVLKAGCLLLAILLPSSATASSRTAARHVLEGIRHFRSGQYQAAGKAFAEADVALPENPKIAFDQGCALAAQDDVEKARELFQTASLSRDDQVVAGAHYNLGCLAASKGRAAFGEHPENAAAESRQEGLTQLVEAISHYRDCLRVDESHVNARRNLEVLRMWMKRMQDVWSQRDREKQREDLDLLQFLEMIQSRQEGLRHTARMVQREDDSPRRRQAVTQVESAQRSLAEEIQPLREKIRQTLQPPAAQQTPPAPPAGQAADTEKAIEVLTGVATRAGDAMSKAADQLSTGAIEEAVGGQGEVLDLLNDIFMTIAPFSNLLSKTTGVQAGLVDQSNAVVRPEDDEGSGQGEPVADVSEMTRQQTVVSRWSKVLPFKAEQELQQLQAGQAGADPAAKDPHSGSAPQQQQQQQQEGLKVALEKAVQTGPAIEQLAVEAAADLENEDLESALPKQEEVLKLLKEIAETLPKQEQNEQDQQNQQDQGEGQQQENKQQDQQPSNQDSQQPKQPEQNVSKQQAEALMRKVRERERDYRQQKKQLRGLFGGGAKVDKDW